MSFGRKEPDGRKSSEGKIERFEFTPIDRILRIYSIFPTLDNLRFQTQPT